MLGYLSVDGERVEFKNRGRFFAACFLVAACIACNGPQVRRSDAGGLPDGNVQPRILIKRAVLEHLGLRRGLPNRQWGAFFVSVDPDEIKYFTDLFRGNVPRVDLSDDKHGRFQNMQMVEGAIVDKITKLPGVSYGFQKIEISNGHAEVEAVVSFGLFALTIFTYDLELKDNKWIVRSCSEQTIS